MTITLLHLQIKSFTLFTPLPRAPFTRAPAAFACHGSITFVLVWRKSCDRQTAAKPVITLDVHPVFFPPYFAVLQVHQVCVWTPNISSRTWMTFNKHPFLWLLSAFTNFLKTGADVRVDGPHKHCWRFLQHQTRAQPCEGEGRKLN